MKIHQTIFRLFAPGAILFLASAFGGQPVDNPRSQNSDILQGMAVARLFFYEGKYSQGENALSALNISSPGSAEWSLETAGRLTALALAFRHEADQERALTLAQRALDQLALAANKVKPNDSAIRARIETMVGAINERLLGTTTQAKARYRAALEMDPTFTPASDALKRVDNAGKAQGNPKS